jgi:hypothetical protein
MGIIECKKCEKSTHMKFGELYIPAVRKEKQPISLLWGSWLFRNDKSKHLIIQIG